jgi:hypothetical protein
MANTAPYRCPPPHQFPPAEDCTDEDLLDIAARAASGALHELMSSSPHVLAICHLVEHLELQIAAARAAGAAAARMADEQTALRVAALADALELRQQAAQLSAENAQLRIQAGLDTLALTVTGRSAADLQAEHAVADRVERKRAARFRSERQAMAAVATLEERQRADTVEIVPCVVERARVRCINPTPLHEKFDVVEPTEPTRRYCADKMQQAIGGRP